MRLHHRFEWDSKKAASNRKKHGISFDAAVQVLLHKQAELFHSEVFDAEHSEFEDRWVTISAHPEGPSVVINVCWTERDDGATRIISARHATKQEIKHYEEEIRDR